MREQKITSELIVAYWQCPRKAFFLLNESQQAVPHELDSFFDNYRHRNRHWYFRQLKDKFGNPPSYNSNLVGSKHPVLLEAELEYKDLFASVDALLKTDSEQCKKKIVYVPVLVAETHVITQDQKVALAFAGIVLSHIQHSPCRSGKILSSDRKVHLVKFEKQERQVQGVIRVLRSWIQEIVSSPPDVFLNKNCPLCPFRTYCHSEAIQINHLSLLSGLSQKQIRDYRNKGIFTVTQLADTYRARKRRRQEKQQHKYNHALKAMAIRDKLVYALGMEEKNLPYPYIFLDIEGVPDRNFYYLIGLFVVTESDETQYSFWADQESDEESIWRQFLNIIAKYNDFTIFHYGSYDEKFINIMIKRYSNENDPIKSKIKSRLINLLSLIYGSIYFPTYSNSLKEIGSYIGFQWTHPESSGLQSIVWRYRWEESKDKKWKNILITYNAEDCDALKNVTQTILNIYNGEQDALEKASVKMVETIKSESLYKFGKTDFLLSDFEHINSCAYYDYQREKVYFRSERKKHRQLSSRSESKRRRYRVNKQVEIPAPERCEHCSNTMFYRHSRQHKIVFDIRFNEAGFKRWVVQYQGNRTRFATNARDYIVTMFKALRTSSR